MQRLEQHSDGRFVLRTAVKSGPSLSTTIAINLIIFAAIILKVMMLAGIAVFLFLWAWDTSYLLWPFFVVTLALCIALCHKGVVHLRAIKRGN